MVTFVADLFTFSPNGIYLACLNHTERQILIRKCDIKKEAYNSHNASSIHKDDNRFNVEHKFHLHKYNRASGSSSVPSAGPITSLVWSPDSCFLAASSKKNAGISVFSVLEPSWKCIVNLGNGFHSLESFMWARDARHLICVSEDISFLSVWSIRSKQVNYIKDICPIPSCAGLSYSSNGNFLAISQISSTCSISKPYYVAIYSTSASKSSSKQLLELISKFSVAAKDLAGISWCPAGGSGSTEYLCLWDSNLFSNLYVYNVKTGALIKQYSPYGMTSSGFSSVQWTTTGHSLVCTVQNKNELHVLNGLTFGVLIHDVLEPERSSKDSLETDMERYTGQYEIFYEANKVPSLGMNKYHRLSKWPSISLDSRSLLKLQVHLQAPPSTVHVKLAPDGRFLSCTTSFYPQILWIYDLISTASPIAVLIHQHSVLDFDWNPTSHIAPDPIYKLVIICKSPDSSRGLLYFWTLSGDKKTGSKAYMHNTTAKFSFSRVQWSPHGDILLIRDNSQRIHLLTNL